MNRCPGGSLLTIQSRTSRPPVRSAYYTRRSGCRTAQLSGIPSGSRRRRASSVSQSGAVAPSVPISPKQL
ncbi:MAG TPA: hypothetical protein VGS41_00550, partial [Chthonomonadales bacterium]|nr:hypothetical protein [Chthonomonadales bacterium]